MIKVACSGFPVSKRLYASKLRVVELKDLFNKTPRPGTIAKWREDSPDDFEFVVCASKNISHQPKSSQRVISSQRSHTAGRFGRFQDTADVRHAYGQTFSIASTLQSRVIFFQVPPNLTPHADTIGRLQAFFNGVERGNCQIVWEPPPHWPASMVDILTAKLRITPAINPLSQKPSANAPMRYYRLGDNKKTRGVYGYTNSELRDVRAACDKPLSYVVFNNGPTAFDDAVKFLAII